MKPDGFELLYEEGPCLVVAKPGGLLTQAPPGIDSLEIRVKQFLKQRDNKSGNVYLGVPHRLDRPVSGALVLARHVRAAKRLSDQFAGRTVEKVYWAVVGGTVSPSEGTWQDQLRKVPEQARSEILAADAKESRSAVLHYRVLRHLPNATWLEIRLETGRYHQIRVQFSGRGYPVVGDALYGSTFSFGPICDDPRDRWIALHARGLGFRHPMTRERICVSCELPHHWQPLGIRES